MSYVMRVVDRLDKKFGRNTVRFGPEGVYARWRTKAEKRSCRYTTQWDEILVI
jgi:DNA polymerase V